MGSFGSQSSNQSGSSSSGINDKFLPYALDALNRAEQVGNQGYVPYRGIDVALPDSMVNSWQQTANRAASFNTPGQVAQNIRSQLPLSKQAGVQGLSSFAGYQDQLNKLKASSPGLYNYIKSFAIDPKTGKPGDNTLHTAQDIADAANNNNGNNGNSGPGAFNPTLMQLIQQGGQSGGPMGAQMAFMGLPYFSRGQGMTSAYSQLFDKYINQGANQDPWGAMFNSSSSNNPGTTTGGGSMTYGTKPAYNKK